VLFPSGRVVKVVVKKNHIFLFFMYIRLIRNQAKGTAITGRLVIDGRWFCNTLERVGYQIPALCYHVAITQSPKFKRLLPIVQNVPRLPIADSGVPEQSIDCWGALSEASNRAKPVQYPAAECRTGIRIHRGTKPEHSTGCILVVADNPSRSRELIRAEVVDIVLNNKIPIGGRSAAEVENQLTQLLLQTQQAHEEIILEVIDFTPGTEYGYNHPCPPELQKP
jgi:hypothetical protein